MNMRVPALLLLMLYGATGITALAYEVLWTRMLSLMFGISIFGVVFTVAAFMAGLGIGSFLLTAHTLRLQPARALVFLAMLEGAVALYALLLPWVMPAVDAGLLQLGHGLALSGWQGLQGGGVMLLLFPPAIAMGLAFPLALRAASALNISLASMYGVNALGGAIGAILPLALLPVFGWQISLWVVASIGVAVAAGGWLLSRRLVNRAEPDVVAESPVTRPAWVDLLAYAGIGAAALMLEVLWTREYGMVLLRTEYILAVLLLVYLAGIGIGSLLARRADVRRWLNVMPVAAAAAAVVAQYALPHVSQWAADHAFGSLAGAMVAQGGMVALLTLPVTLMLGAWLPLLASHFADRQMNAGGWWYGANSVGAAAGALLAGFVLLPWLGTAMSICAAALLLMLCGMRWASDRRIWLALPLLLVLCWPVRQLPAVAALLPALSGSTDLSVYEDAVSLTHVVEQANGQRVLLSDLQRMDASSDPTAVTVQKNQARLPLLLHPDPRSVLFLGLGTGVTASGSLPFAGLQRTAVELSAGAILAADHWFEPVNGGVATEMRIVHDDARRFLRTDNHQYDVIVGDLFHPDMVGRANLLSIQEFQRARQRLNDGGVFVQWLALNQFDIDSLKVVMHTFAAVFEHASLFVDGYRIALVGFNGPFPAVPALLARYQQLDVAQQSEQTGHEGLWSWLGRYWGEIPSISGRVQDEWVPVIEFSLPKVRYGQGIDMVAMWRWLLSWRAEDRQAFDRLGVPAAEGELLKRARVATALDVRLWMAELEGDERRVVAMARLAHRANADDRWPAFALADRMYDSLERATSSGMSRRQALERILAMRPDHEQAMRAMMLLDEQQGDAVAAEVWHRRLQAISPLAKYISKR
ncbi:spermine synthase [Mariprofundus erugo]|uniref:fused MFS/spermidine synthase n=1 Tax=Mariprofundus erugo TaxID=2528639 RepID=UPI0010FED7A1|nr:fused MFS/spermidine synthase [Mariprofundus erugo]TLS77900.1 spermine synthase [Mariprofundus erugo]